jgi:hypothetical protein
MNDRPTIRDYDRARHRAALRACVAVLARNGPAFALYHRVGFVDYHVQLVKRLDGVRVTFTR